jgi:hypothetical protein
MRLSNWFIGISIVTFATASIDACRCLPPGEPKYELSKSPAVFSGKVISMKKAPGMTQRVTFQVLKTWKGARKKQRVVTVSTDPAGCGYEFQNGKKYLVYTSGAPDKLEVSICSRTLFLEMADDDIRGFK